VGTRYRLSRPFDRPTVDGLVQRRKYSPRNKCTHSLLDRSICGCTGKRTENSILKVCIQEWLAATSE
jgi:hypothetical protein